MSDEADWGPWVQHDGMGCPVAGRLVHLVLGDSPEGYRPEDEGEDVWTSDVVEVISPREALAIPASCGNASWWWRPGWFPVIRYRVRRPRALRELIDLVEGLPAPAVPLCPTVDA